MDDPVDRKLLNRLRHKVGKLTDPQDAEDVINSAYLRLHKYQASHIVGSVEAFLLKAARNIVVDNFRRRASSAWSGLDADCNEVSDSAPLQDEVIEARMRLSHVQAGLEQLSPRTRQIFEMHRLDNLKYREIAVRLGLSQSAVEKHIAKAALFIGQWAKDWED